MKSWRVSEEEWSERQNNATVSRDERASDAEVSRLRADLGNLSERSVLFKTRCLRVELLEEADLIVYNAGAGAAGAVAIAHNHAKLRAARRLMERLEGGEVLDAAVGVGDVKEGVSDSDGFAHAVAER